MEIRDYIRMLKRGWPVVLLFAILFTALAAAYLALTPRSYASTAVLFASTNDPATVGELQIGAQFSASAMNTYAEIIDSSTILSPVAAQLTPQSSVDELVQMITATRRPDTTLIDVTATGENSELVAVVANATAESAAAVIPRLTSSSGQPLVRLQLIRPAVEPVHAISPNARRILVLGLIVGACLGLSATIATQALDTRIRRIHDLRMLTEVPVLAVLPRVKRKYQNNIVVREEPAGASGEAFRTLRTNVRFLDLKDRRSMVFTTVADSRDAADVPDNLAWMLATAGHRVLLIDLDLRQSQVGNALGIEPGVGIADVLAGQAQLLEVVNHSEHPNLHVVLSGTLQPNPSELLSAPLMDSLLRRMESAYDYVILHAPPLLSYTDAAVVSGVAGGTVVTVTAGHTRAQELTTSLTVLANVGVRPVGLVLTRATRSVLEHKKVRGDSTRSRFRVGRPMQHRLDWDWRSSDPGRHSAN